MTKSYISLFTGKVQSHDLCFFIYIFFFASILKRIKYITDITTSKTIHGTEIAEHCHVK